MLKRGIDILVAGAALLILSPVLILVMILVYLDSGGPIFFVQRRVGADDQEFDMYKFRTMVVGTPNVATDKLTNSAMYVTGVGQYLRKYSMDELPQLWNILSGDMSIVGPRPALYNQYTLREMRKQHNISSMRPGLTGWAQINGRDNIGLEEKVKLDLYYFKNLSTRFDLYIIVRTAMSVVCDPSK
ncbi:sugar transferase [Pelosinus baikalensis]|uniref:Sugar transferase n=1 Tax=Pelosinus baikalensis TaxID=2892015 RepID=A0ABS8HLZ9_9FIRM|nr:sugar transferase [Pelosinus baikalensis]MCC5464080.1 sugar transferase [Pelosinus baikalensis]